MPILLFGSSLLTYAQQNEILIPYRKGKLWGLADTTGTVVIAPIYDEVDPSLSKEICYVRKENRWGVITTQNQPVLPVQFDKVKYDSQGKFHCYEITKDSLRGIYSSNGTALLLPRYSSYMSMHSGSTFNVYVVHDKKIGLYLLNWKKNEAVCLLKEQFDRIIPRWSGSTLYFKSNKRK